MYMFESRVESTKSRSFFSETFEVCQVFSPLRPFYFCAHKTSTYNSHKVHLHFCPLKPSI